MFETTVRRTVLVMGLSLLMLFSVLGPASAAQNNDANVLCGGGPGSKNLGYTKVEGASGNVTLDFGTLQWSGDTLTYDLNEGVTVELCLKGGTEFPTEKTASWNDEPNTVVHTSGISHIGYRMPSQDCPEGTTGDYPDCTPIVTECPTGTTGTYPDCTPIVTECPTGTTGTYPDCTPIVTECPPGTTGTPPSCVPVTTTIPDPDPEPEPELEAATLDAAASAECREFPGSVGYLISLENTDTEVATIRFSSDEQADVFHYDVPLSGELEWPFPGSTTMLMTVLADGLTTPLIELDLPADCVVEVLPIVIEEPVDEPEVEPVVVRPAGPDVLGVAVEADALPRTGVSLLVLLLSGLLALGTGGTLLRRSR
jgi:hypothetical protein